MYNDAGFADAAFRSYQQIHEEPGGLMRRSEINRALRRMEDFINGLSVSLPPFCGFTPEEWKSRGHEFDEIRDNMLGWDITDYGLGNFAKVGFSLITLRNGNTHMSDRYGKPYAEKLLFLEEGQYSPNHFHWYKMEDIINRGGGNLLIRVYNSLPDEEVDRVTDVTVHTDGCVRTVKAGTQIRLTPGESISIQQRMYHDFEVEPGTGAILIGEVSQCNDDNTDNRFNPPVGRFPAIEEDEQPYRLLCNEYPKAGS
jgi:D-lyxose ketol-isomerase